jgi:hypothetical protein
MSGGSGPSLAKQVGEATLLLPESATILEPNSNRQMSVQQTIATNSNVRMLIQHTVCFINTCSLLFVEQQTLGPWGPA